MSHSYAKAVAPAGITLPNASGQPEDAYEQPRPTPDASVGFGLKTRFLARLFIGSVAGLAALCVAALAYGHFRPGPDVSATLGLDRCDNKPCFRGMIPGQTDWSIAQVVLALLGNSQIFKEYIFVRIGSDGSALLYPSRDGVTVGSIFIDVPTATRLSLGEIIQHYGPPCGLNIPKDPAVNNSLVLDYPQVSFSAQVPTHQPTIDTPVRHIVFSDPADLVRWALNLCQEDDAAQEGSPAVFRPWRGFASVRTYLTEVR
jgi:hypothetical protein